MGSIDEMLVLKMWVLCVLASLRKNVIETACSHFQLVVIINLHSRRKIYKYKTLFVEPALIRIKIMQFPPLPALPFTLPTSHG